MSEAPGAGSQLHGGFAIYTKVQKAVALGVPAELLQSRTAVCEDVARAMVARARWSARALTWRLPSRVSPARHEFFRFGDIGRGHIRYRTVVAALELLGAVLADEPAAAAAGAVAELPVSRRRPA